MGRPRRSPALRPTLELRLDLTFRPQFVSLLELPDDALDERIQQLVAENPALIWSPGRGPGIRRGGAGGRSERDGVPWESRTSAAAPDLERHLVEQLRLERCAPEVRAAATMIIGNLDGFGFLSMAPAEVAQAMGLSLEVVHAAQDLVMTRLEPEGCGATDLRHYLAYRVRTQWPEDPFFEEMVTEHLEALRHRRFRPIAAAMALEAEDVEEYLRMLTHDVEPWPARGHAGPQPEIVVATLQVEHVQGHWRVRRDATPSVPVQVDPGFEARVLRAASGPERRRARRHLERARALIQDLEDRGDLVHRVATCVVQRQAAFFATGPRGLRHLTQQEVARAVQRHGSVVSRAVAGRFLLWRGESIALRALFVNRGGPALSPVAELIAALQDVVAGEDPRHPLADGAIARALAERGLTGVARRTVAKYRAALGIPPSRLRARDPNPDGSIVDGPRGHRAGMRRGPTDGYAP